MNVNISPRGHSFYHLKSYLMNPKRGESQERVGNTVTFNLPTDDIDQATKLMVWTDKNREFLQLENGGNGRGAAAQAGNVYHVSKSWHPEENPTWDQMVEAFMDGVKEMGLGEHQMFLVEHTETGHKHLHGVICLVHPETGKIHNTWKDRYKWDRWANEYEKEHGIRCKNRADKYEELEQDRKKKVYPEKKLDHSEAVTRAFRHSDNGKSFQAALKEEDLVLAQGKRRAFVVVDRNGDIFNVSKTIEFDEGVTGRKKTHAVKEHLKDLDRDALPHADFVAQERLSVDRDAQEVEQQKALADAAEKAAPELAAKQDQIQKELEKQKAAEDSKKRQLEEQRQRKIELRREEQRRRIQQQLDITRRTKESRERWKIDEHARAVAQAREKVEQYDSWWKRLFQHRAYVESRDHLQDMEKRLEERTWRHHHDIEAFNQDREPEERRQEFERYGVTPQSLRREFGEPSQQKLEPERIEVSPTPEIAPEPEDEAARRQREKEEYLVRRAMERQREELDRDQDRGLER